MLRTFRKLISRFLWTLMSLMATMAIFFGALYAYMEFQLPDVSVLKDVHMQVPLRVYSANDKLIAEYGAKRRAPVSLQKVPKLLIEAVLATEDARFYSHAGVDFIGILRAAAAVIATGRKVQGASTITMQVARNFFLSSKKTYSRKIKEILLAIKIDRSFSKEKILELYLNKVYFGNRAYGVSAAARVYYGKDLDQLTLPQLAMIAGLPQAPSRNNPLKNPEQALNRRNHVLKRMYEVHYIDKATYEQAIQAPNTATYHEERAEVHAPYIAEMVRQALVLMYGDRAYDTGFKVTTTINPSLQTAAAQALKNGIMMYDKRHPQRDGRTAQGAMVVLDPKTGAILALQGGYNYQDSVFNRALQALRQPGSSFKPFVYAAALDKGFTLASIINDAPIIMKDTGENRWWRPENDTKSFYGPTRLRVGLTESRNLVSIRLLQEMGIDYALPYIQRFGFNAPQLPHSLSLALGSGVVTPLQIAVGYASFANGGNQVTPFFIEKITNEKHQVVYQSPSTIKNPVVVMRPQIAYLMTQAMRGVIQTGTARAARVLKRTDLAGKTGTTNHQVDAWFSGFNSNLLATVWVGFDDSNMSLHEYGAQAALPIWIQFMKTALNNAPEATMEEPDNIVAARIDPQTGLLASPGEQDAIFEVFEKQHMPTHFAHNAASVPASASEEHVATSDGRIF